MGLSLIFCTILGLAVVLQLMANMTVLDGQAALQNDTADLRTSMSMANTTVQVGQAALQNETADPRESNLSQMMEHTTVQVGRKPGSLSWYGYEYCPWMALPPDTRYPRHPMPHQISTKLGGCIKKLLEKQKRGDIIFFLTEGQSLAAQVSGGFHGGTDDDDIDLILFSRETLGVFSEGVSKGKPILTQWCKENGVHLGQFAIKTPAPATRGSGVTNRDLFKEDIKNSNKTGPMSIRSRYQQPYSIADACIAHHSGMEVLIRHPKDGWLFGQHGGSYWVPPVAGGKHTGAEGNYGFKDYMNPKHGFFPWFFWLQKFIKGLQSGVDKNGDGAISLGEFNDYVDGNRRVNQKWLAKARADRPCVVANALIHYQHCIKLGTLAMSMRQKCEDEKKPRERCSDDNWQKFELEFGAGPNYFEDSTKDFMGCRRFLELE